MALCTLTPQLAVNFSIPDFYTRTKEPLYFDHAGGNQTAVTFTQSPSRARERIEKPLVGRISRILDRFPDPCGLVKARRIAQDSLRDDRGELALPGW